MQTRLALYTRSLNKFHIAMSPKPYPPRELGEIDARTLWMRNEFGSRSADGIEVVIRLKLIPPLFALQLRCGRGFCVKWVDKRKTLVANLYKRLASVILPKLIDKVWSYKRDYACMQHRAAINKKLSFKEWGLANWLRECFHRFQIICK